MNRSRGFSNAATHNNENMIHRIVQFSLRQRFLVLMLTAFVAVGGAVSFKRMPVDAYPDLSPPQVELITQWPGHAAEEIERLVTLPIEVEMNGAPNMDVMRSISLYGLSDVRLTFDEGTDDYFARQVVFERLSDVQPNLPTGVQPSMAPLFSPSGLVYRYVLESPDRSPQELKTYEDWVIERQYKQVRGVADDSGFGGTVMQYQVLLDPARLYGYHITVPQVVTQLGINNANTGGGFYSQGGQFYYVRGLGLIRDQADIASVDRGNAERRPGAHPRRGRGDDRERAAARRIRFQQSGRRGGRRDPDAPRRADPDRAARRPGENEGNQRAAFCRRMSRCVRSTIAAIWCGSPRTRWRRTCCAGWCWFSIVLIFFLVSFRAALIVALTIPLALLFAFIFLHAHDVAANLLSIGAIDFGIIIDGTLVMVENIFRVLGEREGQKYDLHEVILEAAKDVDRPIFYSVAVIIAGYIPIYALSGPSGKLFHPMADTMSVALVGALILTLTFVPVMCSYWFKKGVRERRNAAFEWIKEKYGEELTWCLDHPKTTMIVATLIFGATLLLVPFIGGEFMPHLDEGALWVRATMPYTISYRRGEQVRAADSRADREVSAGDGSRLRAGPSGRRHRSHRFLQLRILCGAETLQRPFVGKEFRSR